MLEEYNGDLPKHATETHEPSKLCVKVGQDVYVNKRTHLLSERKRADECNLGLHGECGGSRVVPGGPPLTVVYG